MSVPRPLILAACLVAPFFGASAVLANDGPGCHGNNETECRPDPNEHGQDCDEHGQHDETNDDHCATTTTAGVVTTITLAPTTTTTAAPTTTTVAPTTTTLAMTPFVPEATTTTVPTAVLGTRVERLPTTGFPVGFLTVIGGLAVAFGVTSRYVAKLEDE